MARKADNPAPLSCGTAPHLLPQNLVVSWSPVSTDTPQEDLLGKTIRHRDGNGEIASCTIHDFGTSRLKGDWYLVSYDDGGETEITANEMKDILDSRVADEFSNECHPLASMVDKLHTFHL